MLIVTCYAIYLAISLGVTVWVAETLRRNGRAFLVDAFHNNAELADSVNHLLVVGFYLINIGYVVSTMQTSYDINQARYAFELIANKLGAVLVMLGLIHFANMWVFNRLRMRGRRHAAPGVPAGWSGDAPLGKVLD